MKRVLITGGLGFLGSYCIEKFKREGWDITVVDNCSTNVIEPTDPIVKNNVTKFLHMNVLGWNWFFPPVSNEFDLIVHLASPVGPVGVLKHSGKMAGYIIDDVYWAIKGAQICDCPLIFISTSEVYGYRDAAVFLKERDSKLLVGDYSVRNEYSTAKLLSEIILDNTAKVNPRFKYQILRPFNISGARQLKDGGFVLPTFVNQALNGEDITVFGDGQQIRAFTHVTDIVDGIYLVATAIDEDYNEIWNVGNPENVASIHDLALMVADNVKTESNITFVDPKTIHGPLYEEAWDKIPDSKKIIDRLGWSPKHGKDYIVQDVIKHYRRD